MNEVQIASFLKGNKLTKRLFLGTLAYDELPYKQKEGFYIVNTGHSSTSGIHWIVVLKRDGLIEYFDSLGNSPEFYTKKIEEYLFRNCDSYKMNLKRIQGNSNFCGNYCIFFSFLRCKNYSMSNILDLFSDNLELNDVLVDFN